MPLPPPRDHKIPLNEAATLTRRYRDSVPAGSTIAGMYHRAAIDALLAQRGCAGVRIYYGRDANGELTTVLVGVDAEGNDMTAGEVLDFHFPCPPICSAAGPLNS